MAEGGNITMGVPPLALVQSLLQNNIPISPFSFPGASLLPQFNPQNFPNGGLSQMIPAGYKLDSINNVPSNVPGGAGGGFGFASLLQTPTFIIPKMQAFDTPAFNQALIHPQSRFPKGGNIQRRQARLERRQNRLEQKGKTGSAAYTRISDRLADIAAGGRGQTQFGNIFHGIGQGLKGAADWNLSLIGANDLIQDSFVDKSKFLSGISNTLGQIAPMALNAVAPGLGTGVSFLGQGLNSLGGGQGQGMQQPQQQQGFGSLFGGLGNVEQFQSNLGFNNLFGNIGGSGKRAGFSPFSMFGGMMGGIGGGQGGFGGMGNAMGQLPFGSQFGTPFQGNALAGLFGGMKGTPGINPNAPSPFGNLFGGFQPMFEKGGLVTTEDLVPIQTEKVGKIPERIIHLDGSITDVNAKTRHKNMDDDFITDMIPSGSYILSATKGMRISRDRLDKLTMGWDITPYSENKKGKPPKELKFTDFLPSGKKYFTPSELGHYVRKNWKIKDFDVMDPFIEVTNEENLKSRLPYLQLIIALNELKKGPEKPFKGIRKAPTGGNFWQTLGDIGTVAGTALPFLQSLFGGGGGQGGGQGLDPMTSALLTGAFPLNTAGTIANVRAQQNSLANAQGNLTGLTSDLIGLNNFSTGLGALGYAGLETDAPLLRSDFSRLENFNTRTPRAFSEARATPNFDIGSIMGRLGRGSAPIVADLLSNQQRLINEGATRDFERTQGLDFQIANLLTNLGVEQDVRNQAILASNMGNRNARDLGFVGQLQQGAGQHGNILSNAFTVGTGLDLQRAGLTGQIPQRIAQDAVSLATIRQTLLNQQNGYGGQGGYGGGQQGSGQQGGSGLYQPNFGALENFGNMFGNQHPFSGMGQSSYQSMPILSGLGQAPNYGMPILNGFQNLGKGPLGIPIYPGFQNQPPL